MPLSTSIEPPWLVKGALMLDAFVPLNFRTRPRLTNWPLLLLQELDVDGAVILELVECRLAKILVT